MSDLTEFLLTRIAGREAVALDMKHQAAVGRPFFDLDRLAGGTGIRELIDPARVLADCEAKRRRVKVYEAGWISYNDDNILGELLALEALPYADHPDYREEWRP